MENSSPQIQLSLEQQFGIASFNSQVDQMNEQQAKDLLKLVNLQLEITKVTYLQLLAHNWGIGDGTNKRPAEE